jgi:hypothetical protein
MLFSRITLFSFFASEFQPKIRSQKKKIEKFAFLLPVNIVSNRCMRERYLNDRLMQLMQLMLLMQQWVGRAAASTTDKLNGTR